MARNDARTVIRKPINQGLDGRSQRMDVTKQEMFGRFKAIVQSHVEYRRREMPAFANEDWVVKSFEDLEQFVREVESRFPDWNDFAIWLDQFEKQKSTLRRRLDEDTARLSAGGLSKEDFRRADRTTGHRPRRPGDRPNSGGRERA